MPVTLFWTILTIEPLKLGSIKVRSKFCLQRRHQRFKQHTIPFCMCLFLLLHTNVIVMLICLSLCPGWVLSCNKEKPFLNNMKRKTQQHRPAAFSALDCRSNNIEINLHFSDKMKSDVESVLCIVVLGDNRAFRFDHHRSLCVVTLFQGYLTQITNGSIFFSPKRFHFCHKQFCNLYMSEEHFFTDSMTVVLIFILG